MDSESLDISSEDIQHLIFRSEPIELKFPMYRSKFSEKVRADRKLNKDCHKTFGYAYDYPKPDPAKDYLKKGTKVICRPVVEVPKPPAGPLSRVPRRDEWNELVKKPQPNYIVQNIRKVHKAIPKTGPSRYVSTKGLRFHNCNLLIPKFSWEENFGKVPEYLKKIKDQLAEDRRVKEEKRKLKSETKKKSGLTRITSQERLELLGGLKVAWAGLQKEYQLLPMLNDTPPKIKHKEQLEGELTALEKEIQTIEDHKVIYVYEDPNIPICQKFKSKDPCYEH